VVLHYKSSGNGEPVIILHGLFGMLDNWRTFARHLSESYAVYTPDLRNHGRSPHSDEFNYNLLAEDLREFVATHDLAPATIMGHSLGGKTAMQFALQWPHLVSRLIVVDIAPKAYEPQHQDVVSALSSIDPTTTESRGDIELVLMEQLKDAGVVQFLMKNLGRAGDGNLMWRMNLASLTSNYANTSASIQGPNPYMGPTLFVRGGRSRYIEDGDLAGIQELFPAATLITIPDAGHWVHADAMEELLAATTQFILANPVNDQPED
jgi:pimeloyl-ACP methyl ester carboxylesterase